MEPGPAREATIGTVRALIEVGRIVRCAAGHRDPPPVGDDVAASVLTQVPTADTRRLTRSDRCVTCGEPLTMPARRTDRSASVAEVPGLPVTTVLLDIPSTRCLTCSTDQVPTRSVDDLRRAVVALFAPDADAG